MSFFWVKQIKANRKQQSQFLQEKERCENEIRNSNEIIKRLHIKDSLQFLSEQTYINLDIRVFLLNENRTMKLREAVTEKKEYLVLRLTEKNCASCYDFVFNRLLGTEKDKLIIFGSFSSFRNFKVILKENGLDMFQAYNFNEPLTIPMEQWKSPYIFKMTNNGKTHQYFAVDKSNPMGFYSYIKKVNK